MFQRRFDYGHVLPMFSDVCFWTPQTLPCEAFVTLAVTLFRRLSVSGKKSASVNSEVMEITVKNRNDVQVHREVYCRLKHGIGQWAANTPKESLRGKERRADISSVTFSSASHGSTVAFNPHESKWKNMLCLRHVRSPSLPLSVGCMWLCWRGGWRTTRALTVLCSNPSIV
jgi:hypothetical protein